MALISILHGQCFIPTRPLFHSHSTALSSHLHFNHDFNPPQLLHYPAPPSFHSLGKFSFLSAFISIAVFIPSPPLLHCLLVIPHGSYLTRDFILYGNFFTFARDLSVFIHDVLHSCRVNKQNRYLLIIIVEKHIVVIVFNI